MGTFCKYGVEMYVRQANITVCRPGPHKGILVDHGLHYCCSVCEDGRSVWIDEMCLCCEPEAQEVW